jgi:hypothetical protein
MWCPNNLQVISTLGHSAVFTATPFGSKEPNLTPVHPAIVKECQAKGAVLWNPDDVQGTDDTSSGPIGFAGKLRTTLIYLVLQRIIDRNNPQDFNSGGVPKTAVVAAATSFDVSDKEVKKAWQTFNDAQNSGKTLDVDERATLALDIIDASNVAELKMVAEEMGVDPKDYETLTKTRELKQFLLAKFA